MFGNDCLFLQRFLKSLSYYRGELDGDYGPLTDAALQAFEEETQRLAEQFGRFDHRSERNIATLHTKAQEMARQLLRAVTASGELKREGGAIVRIISGTRTYKEQSELYMQGRTRPGRIVTNAPAGRSNHNFGIAWDVGLFRGAEYLQDSPLYDKLGRMGKSMGLEWGGDWASLIDKAHFQLAAESTLAEVRAKFEQGQIFV